MPLFTPAAAAAAPRGPDEGASPPQTPPVASLRSSFDSVPGQCRGPVFASGLEGYRPRYRGSEPVLKSGLIICLYGSILWTCTSIFALICSYRSS